MSRAKQIEEIEEIEEIVKIINKDCGGQCIKCDYQGIYPCYENLVANDLYNAGYRKASEVAEEIFEEIEKTFKDCLWFLENHPSNYPRMDRTKINVYKDALLYLAELKKKYTESEGGE